MATAYWPSIVPPNAYVTGQGTSLEQVVFREQFTGDGLTTTFQLTSSIGNAIFVSGAWSASRILTTAPSHINDNINYQPIYDSTNIFTRNRINVVSINSSGLVTLDFAPRSGQNFVIWYWYHLQSGDDIDDYLRDDFVAEMEGDINNYEAVPVNRIDYIPQAPSAPYQEGRSFYDDATKSLSIYNDKSDITWNLGREFFRRSINNTGNLIPNGSVVYINATGIQLAIANSIATSNIVGIATHDVANGEEGEITRMGAINGVDTSLYPVGTKLWLSDTTPGGFTNIPPPLRVFVGEVEIQHVSNGRIHVGFEALRSENAIVYVTSLADLPTPIANEIQLADNVIYFFIGAVNVGINELVLGEGTQIIGNSIYQDSIIYTGSNSLINAEDVNISIGFISISAINGNVFNFINTAGNEGTTDFSCFRVRILDASSLGVFQNPKTVTFFEFLVITTSVSGFFFSGNLCGTLQVKNLNVDSFSGVLFSFGTSVWNSITIHENEFSIGAGDTLISGATGSANLGVRGRATVNDNKIFNNTGTVLSGVTKKDSKWFFKSNTGQVDSIIFGLMVWFNNLTATNIVTTGVFVKAAGTTVSSGTVNERITHIASNRLRYDGLLSNKLILLATVSIAAVVGATNKIIQVAVFKNGIAMPSIAKTATTNGPDPVSVTIFAYDVADAVANDFYEIFIANLTDTEDLVVFDGQVILKENK